MLQHRRRGNHIYIGHQRPHQCSQRDCRQWLRVEQGDLALVFDVDRLDTIIGYLARKTPELVDQPYVGLQSRRFLRADGGHIERIGDRPGQQIVGYLFCHLQRHVFLCFIGACAKVGRRHEVRCAEQYAVLCRFSDEDIKAGGAHLTCFQSGAQRPFIHESAPGRIDDDHTMFGFRQRLDGKNVLGLVG